MYLHFMLNLYRFRFGNNGHIRNNLNFFLIKIFTKWQHRRKVCPSICPDTSAQKVIKKTSIKFAISVFSRLKWYGKNLTLIHVVQYTFIYIYLKCDFT
jgi:hypothetical protein